MKINIHIFILFVAFFSIAEFSCKKDSENVSRVTTYDVLTLKGDSVVILLMGQSYIEQGAISSGSYQISINDNINTNLPGTYEVIYTTKNKDGFDTQITRTVHVVTAFGYDLTGTYKGYYGGYYDGDVTVSRINYGLYYVSDLLVGDFLPLVVPYYMYYTNLNTLAMLYNPQTSAGPLGIYGTIAVSQGVITYNVLQVATGQLLSSFKLVKK